jgi:hypothetical protein
MFLLTQFAEAEAVGDFHARLGDPVRLTRGDPVSPFIVAGMAKFP